MKQGFIALLLILMMSTLLYAADKESGDLEARKKYLLRSGVAYDAHEDPLGAIHVKDPKSFFNKDTDQVTWWGEFKPFTGWGRPKLQAQWVNPKGELTAVQDFKGEVCRLAKNTLKMKEGASGLWRVKVYYKGKLLDDKQFELSENGPQNLKKSKEGLPVIEIVKKEADEVKWSKNDRQKNSEKENWTDFWSATEKPHK